jgi:hypothetical protein
MFPWGDMRCANRVGFKIVEPTDKKDAPANRDAIRLVVQFVFNEATLSNLSKCNAAP